MLSMRRLPLPGGGLLLLAALAVPILAHSAKPLMKKIGTTLRMSEPNENRKLSL